MSSSTEILQEYLVKLGYQTDFSSLKKFEDGLGVTGKRVLKLGAAVTSVVAVVEAAAAEFAYSMRKIYFQSELSNTSVKNLKSMEFAGKQVGISTETMAATIQRANEKIFASHGALKDYASAMTGINETGRETGQVLQDLMDVVPNDTIGAQIMSQFGMDQETFMLWKSHNAEFKAAAAEQRKLYDDLGVNFEEAKKTTLEYTHILDHLSSQFGVMADAMLIRFLPSFKSQTEVISNTITYWTNWATGIESVRRSLEGLSASSAWGFLKDVYKNVFGITPEPTTSSGKTTSSRYSSGRITRSGAATSVRPALPGGASRNERNNNPGNIRYGDFAKSMGAIGKDKDGFAIFPDIQSGFSASQRLLAGYGRKGINTISGIIGRWAPSSENDTGAYSAYMSKAMGMSENAKLDMTDPAVLAKLSTNIAKYEGMSSARLGAYASDNVQMTQTTNINVTGTGAEATAKVVSKEQSRINGDMLRNMKTAMR